MTDNEIIKALETCVASEDCCECPEFRNNYCMNNVMEAALDLIKRQQKRFDRVVEQLEKESYDSMHLDISRPMTETWQIIDLDKAIEIVKGAQDECM